MPEFNEAVSNVREGYVWVWAVCTCELLRRECPRCRWGRLSGKWGFWMEETVWRRYDMPLHRLSAATTGAKPSVRACENSGWLEGSPTLFEFLTQRDWPDGSLREPGTLLVFTEDGHFKACLNDRDSGHSAFASGRTPTDLLEVLEKGLTENGLEWRLKASVSSRKR